VLAIYWLDRHSFSPGFASALFGLKRELFLVGMLCIVLVMATGFGRSFTYIDNVYGATCEQSRRRLLIIKHIALLTVFGLGTWWQYSTIFQ